MFPEYENITAFAAYLAEEECAIVEWAEIGAFVDARSSELEAQARALLASVARRPESIRDDLQQTLTYLRRKACAEVVRALRALGFRIAQHESGDWSPESFSTQEFEVMATKSASFYALLTIIAGQAHESADKIPDTLKGRLQAYGRDGLPSRPEDKRSYAQKLLAAACAVADAGETAIARKLVDSAMVTLASMPAEAPKAETPAEQTEQK